MLKFVKNKKDMLKVAIFENLREKLQKLVDVNSCN